mmetsp:Transcript_7370/g.22133  ORF Transcript_7370/g.22133 Transcript_7370/m.22133 type:complete len:263 (-) Transcript_7370:1808-2596(-)
MELSQVSLRAPASQLGTAMAPFLRVECSARKARRTKVMTLTSRSLVWAGSSRSHAAKETAAAMHSRPMPIPTLMKPSVLRTPHPESSYQRYRRGAVPYTHPRTRLRSTQPLLTSTFSSSGCLDFAASTLVEPPCGPGVTVRSCTQRPRLQSVMILPRIPRPSSRSTRTMCSEWRSTEGQDWSHRLKRVSGKAGALASLLSGSGTPHRASRFKARLYSPDVTSDGSPSSPSPHRRTRSSPSGRTTTTCSSFGTGALALPLRTS